MRGVFAIIGSVAVLAGSPAVASSPFAGYWDGAIKLPGMSLAIHVHLAQVDDGAWQGSIDIPMQGATGLALSDITTDGDSISFVLAEVPGNPTFSGTLDGDRIAGPFTQSGKEFEFELTRGTSERPRRPQDPKPPFPYSSEDVIFKNGDVTLAGTLTIPAGDGPFPAVVLLTGSGPQNRDEELFNHRPFHVIADHLARSGVAVLRTDDRGVGGSTGDIMQSTTSDFADDALTAVRFLRGRETIAPDRIGLLGHSEGGLSAPLAASRSRDVAFLVLLAAPGVPTPELLALQVERITRATGEPPERVQEHVALNKQLTAAAMRGDSDAARELIRRQNELMPPESRPTGGDLERMVQANIDQLFTPWFQSFLQLDPRQALRKVTVPVLALNGTLDLQVVATQNLPAVAAALAQAGNRDVTVHSLPGLNHLFQHATTGTMTEYGGIDETIAPEVLATISEWIVTRFGAEE